MKEIAYRAWDSACNKMLDWATLTQTAFNRSDMSLMYKALTRWNDTLTPMIWTGKQDEDSKDIYESDILICEEDEGDVMLVVWDEMECRFRCDRYGYRHYTGENNQEVIGESYGLIAEDECNMSDTHIYKIIGNKYQNPELLTK